MSRYKVGSPTYNWAVFLKDRAFEICQRMGELERIGNGGVGRSYKTTGFSIWYADPFLIARIEFLEWTPENRLRHPRFEEFGATRMLVILFENEPAP
jgi:hypothetical protein